MNFNIKSIITILFMLCLFIPQISAKEKEIDEVRSKIINTIKDVIKPTEINPTTTNDLQKTKTDLPASIAPAVGEQINWQVLSSGGVVGSSTNYIMNSVIGQTAVGLAASTNLIVNSGFLQNFSDGSCCVGIAGDINGDGGTTPDISDLLYLVDYMFLPPGAAPEPPCMAEADINGDAGSVPDITDLLYLVDYMFLPPGAAPEPLPCL